MHPLPKPSLHSLLGRSVNNNSTEYNSTEYNSTEYNSPEYNSAEYNSTEYNSAEYNSAEYNSAEYNPAEYNPTEYNSTEYNPTEYNPTEYNSAEYNSTEYNSTEYTSTEYNFTEYNSTEYKNWWCRSASVGWLAEFNGSIEQNIQRLIAWLFRRTSSKNKEEKKIYMMKDGKKWVPRLQANCRVLMGRIPCKKKKKIFLNGLKLKLRLKNFIL